MPVISTGGMRYQDGWKDKPLSEVDPKVQKNLEETIAHSIAVGINHIETARGYGVSERQLGTVLPNYPRNELIVQTKIGPEDDPAVFTSNFMESLDRLRLDDVDLLAIHADPRGAASAFDYFNVHWYYIFRRNWPAIEAATKLDMGVFIISPSDKGGKLYAPSPELVELCDPLHPIVFNDLWCLQRPEVHTLSLGAARPSDYDLHLKAVELMDQTDALIGPIDERLRKRMLQMVGIDHPEAMNVGLPEPEQSPDGLNLEVMLWLRHMAVGWGMTDYGRMRFNLLGNGGHWFPGRAVDKDTVLDERAIAAAVKSLPFGQQIPGLIMESHRLLAGEKVKRLSES